MNRKAKGLLVLALVGVVGMAFRVSWNALKDVAVTVGADDTAATLYPFVVDGLMALALVATLALTGDDRRFALRVLAGYTVASLVLNYVHGLVPDLHNAAGRVPLADWSPANWLLVLLATSLPVGSIFFGSDLVAKVLHHHPPNPEESTATLTNQSTPDLRESAPVSLPPVADPAPVESSTPEPTPALTDSTPVALDSAPTKSPAFVTVAAEQSAPRRATGRVPQAARSPRPVRTPEQLLAEGRTATADWPDADLTAEGIRKALRTGAANARTVRDALKAERNTDDAAAAA
ncbi:MAG TPA: hypothetical protein DEQ61_25720 [Streptomyces sp.]|nr:hypothetical protein [Streptomyces sp.]